MVKIILKLSLAFCAICLWGMTSVAQAAAIVNPKPCDWCSKAEKPDQCLECCTKAVQAQDTRAYEKCFCIHDQLEKNFKGSVGECIQNIPKPGAVDGTKLPGGTVVQTLA